MWMQNKVSVCVHAMAQAPLVPPLSCVVLDVSIWVYKDQVLHRMLIESVKQKAGESHSVCSSSPCVTKL